ncbi:Uncharacterised protein [Mycobacteroides abscessus]|uniref:hypothetical protein n=1 Tax=Mycobacteroides abscessus TaxID=36809 RepID=UPI0005E95667|nr:hypothetical protein [Mycobacteroides abscessus]CPX20645.1 Uncharacterised protein [Mycobacteroides abscessus]CRG61234.1 Uncharacterised protein [Mycobacteroides abscessus]
MRCVVAIDPTLLYVSVAVVNEDGTVQCRRIIGDGNGEPTKRVEQKQHPAAALEYITAVAERTVVQVASLSPELVVLRRPDLGTRTKDPHADKRMGLHWALVSALVARDIPVAELGTISAGTALCGNARGGHAAVVGKVKSIYPNLTLPQGRDADGKPDGVTDQRYRVSAVALALLGAVAVRMPTPLEVTDHTWDTLRRGGAWPPSVTIPSEKRVRNRTRSEKELKSNAEKLEAWGETKLEELRSLSQRQLWMEERPTTRWLGARYDELIAEQVAAVEDMSAAELDELPRPENDVLVEAVAARRSMLEIGG